MEFKGIMYISNRGYTPLLTVIAGGGPTAHVLNQHVHRCMSNCLATIYLDNCEGNYASIAYIIS